MSLACVKKELYHLYKQIYVIQHIMCFIQSYSYYSIIFLVY